MQRAQGVSAELVQVIQALVIMILLAFDTPVVAQLWSALGGSKVGAPGAVSEVPNA